MKIRRVVIDKLRADGTDFNMQIIINLDAVRYVTNNEGYAMLWFAPNDNVTISDNYDDFIALADGD